MFAISDISLQKFRARFSATGSLRSEGAQVNSLGSFTSNFNVREYSCFSEPKFCRIRFYYSNCRSNLSGASSGCKRKRFVEMKSFNSSKSHRLLDFVPSIRPSFLSVILVFVSGCLWVKNETTKKRLIALESGAPNENIVQNHLNIYSIVKRILAFKR